MKYFINRSYNKRAKKWRTQSPVSKTVKSTLNKMFIHEAISKLHQNSIWRGKKIIEYTINTWKITVWTAPIHLHLGFFFFCVSTVVLQDPRLVQSTEPWMGRIREDRLQSLPVVDCGGSRGKWWYPYSPLPHF